MKRERLIGAALVVAASVGYGFMGLFRDWAARGGVTSAQSLLFLRFAFAGAVLAALMAARRTPWPRGRMLIILLGMGAIGYFGEALCYFKALELGVPSGLTAVLLYLYPGIVAVLSRVVLRERLGWVKTTAVALAFVGTALAINPFGSGASPSAGIACGVGSALMYAVYIVVGSRVTRAVDPLASSTVVCLGAAGAFGAVTFATDPTWPTTPGAWGAVALLAVVSTVVSVLGILAGMRRIGPVETSTIATTEALTTVLVGAAVLGERLTPVQLVGGAVILAAAVAIARARPSPLPQAASEI